MHTRSDTKKIRLTLQLGNQEWEGRDKQTAIEHVLTCHSVTRLSSIALLTTSGCIFKYRHILILGRKMLDCKSEMSTSSFLLSWRNPRWKLFSYWLRLTVKIACLMQACLNGKNYFQKAD